MSHEWQELIDRHSNILKEHLELWTSVRSQEISGTKSHGVAQGCISRTQEMLQHVELLSGSLAGSKTATFHVNGTIQDQLNESSKSPLADTSTELHSQTEKLSLQPSKKRRMEDDLQKPAKTKTEILVSDYSGLFTIDSNPTPIEQLLAHTSSKDASNESGKRRKIAKPAKEMPPIGLSALTEDTVRKSINEKISAIPTATITTEPFGEGDNNSFLEKVNKRHREKEEKRKSKSDRKRKRESDSSVESQPVESQSNTEKKRRKKQKLEARAKSKLLAKETDGRKESATKNGKKIRRKKKR